MDKKLALETLKSFVENTDNVIAKDAVLTLHPELAESDDERIRQGLLFFIKKEREKKHLTWDDIPLDVYEAYLEKQKEQKPAEWKPSEDQLRKLNQVITIDSELWGEETKEIMKSLYNDLERL